MEIERMPINNMEDRKAKSSAKLTLVDDLDGKLKAIRESITSLASSKGFTDYKLLSADDKIVSGTVDPNNVVTGSWNVEVIQLAEKASAISNGFPDKDTTEVGVGYLKFDTEEGTKEVYVGNEHTTLNGLAQAINNAGIGMQASVVMDKADGDNPYRLILSGRGVGGDNRVDFPKIYLLDGDQDFYFDESREAKNGKIKLDGFEIEVPENTLEDLIPGLVVDLKQAAPGRTINLTVQEDREMVAGKAKGFVESVNAVLSFIQQQNALNEKSDTSRTLGGDQVLRTVEMRLRNLVQGTVVGAGPIQNLSQIGITFNRSGTLEFNEEKFNTVLAKAPTEVQQFLAGDGINTGFIPRLRTTVNGLMDNFYGPVANKRKSLQSEIDRADQRIESIERHLATKEQSLKRKFANLEETMSRLQGQASMVQAKLGGAKG
ncbi:MAG: flagellar filament capping protein FliD [Bdellovibrionales bacterium]|nr:flagellar filament capping protein FliD [Bdellovibrionales bacterium]